jgi:bifunctional ADP-heptose synthase (sugar kinase/adenylyltransferase)
MTRARLEEILGRIRRVSIGVAGDYCLDAYWELDTGVPELSLETGKHTHGVRSQRYTPGGAGNVAANLSALGAGAVCAFGVIGPDLFGRELDSLLRKRGIDTSGMVLQEKDWETPVYAKPYRDGTEEERIDFGRWNTMRSDAPLSGLIRRALPRLDALVVNQQLTPGIHSEAMIRALNGYAREHPDVPFVLDARSMSTSFTGMILKLNAKEAARLASGISREEPSGPVDAIRSHARAIGERCGRPVFVSRGHEGILLFDGSGFADLPAIPLTGPIDPVGAGDATVSAIAAALAAGGTLEEAGELGNLAGAVTVKKLRETGTATPEELLSVARR